MANIIGNENTIYNGLDNRYFYGLFRNDDGELFLTVVDQTDPNEEITINAPGDPVNNYPSFEEGIDFFDGRNKNHDLSYKNLEHEQYKWDKALAIYYINDEGELVMRRHRPYTHEELISTDEKRKQTSSTPNSNKLY